jgi:hypothetical protein
VRSGARDCSRWCGVEPAHRLHATDTRQLSGIGARQIPQSQRDQSPRDFTFGMKPKSITDYQVRPFIFDRALRAIMSKTSRPE